jgi:hypothetical protein
MTRRKMSLAEQIAYQANVVNGRELSGAKEFSDGKLAEDAERDLDKLRRKRQGAGR